MSRDATDGIFINAATGRGISMVVNGGATTALTIASTGEATFSSRVNVNGATDDGSTALNVNGTGKFSGALTGTNGIFTNAGATNVMYLRSSTSGTAQFSTGITGTGANQLDIYSYTDGKTYIQHNGDIVFAPISSITSQFTLSTSGAVTFSSLSGTGSRVVVADASGTLSATDAASTSGTYTPTSQDYGNVTSATNYTAQYMRVGNVVTVSGKITPVTTTGGSFSYLTLSLPIAPNFTTEQQAAGTGAIKNNVSTDLNATIYADIYGGQYVVFQYFTTLSGGHDIFYHFTYLIN